MQYDNYTRYLRRRRPFVALGETRRPNLKLDPISNSNNFKAAAPRPGEGPPTAASTAAASAALFSAALFSAAAAFSAAVRATV